MAAWVVAAFFFACFVFSIFYNIGSSDSKEECKTNHPELIETQAECKTNHPGLIETQAECSSKYPTTCSSTDSTKAECKTNHPELIEHSECGDESVGPDTTSGSGETPMTQQGCLDTYDTLMPTSSCDDIQIARRYGVEDCSPPGEGKIQIHSSARVATGNSDWAGRGDPVCSNLDNNRETDSQSQCTTFYEIHGHPSRVGRTCRASRDGDSGTHCSPGDWCIRQ